MNFKVALTLAAASFMIVASASAEGLFFGSTADSFDSTSDSFGGGYDDGGGSAISSGPQCSLDPRASYNFQAAVDECACFLNESVAQSDYTSFYTYLYENISTSINSNGTPWAQQWGYWGFSVVFNGEDSAEGACKIILMNRPPGTANCYTRCKR